MEEFGEAAKGPNLSMAIRRPQGESFGVPRVTGTASAAGRFVPSDGTPHPRSPLGSAFPCVWSHRCPLRLSPSMVVSK